MLCLSHKTPVGKRTPQLVQFVGSECFAFVFAADAVKAINSAVSQRAYDLPSEWPRRPAGLGGRETGDLPSSPCHCRCLSGGRPCMHCRFGSFDECICVVRVRDREKAREGKGTKDHRQATLHL